MPAKSAKKVKGAKKKANVEALNRKLQTAILANDEEGVRAAVERGADVDGVMASGYVKENMAPLHHVAWNDTSSMVRILVGLEANVNVEDPGGMTAMHIASAKNKLKTVKTLAQLGANIDSQVNDGATPVYLASEFGHTETVRALAQLGANIDKPDDKHGCTPVFIASAYGHTETVRALAQLGANLDAVTNDHGVSALLVRGMVSLNHF